MSQAKWRFCCLQCKHFQLVDSMLIGHTRLAVFSGAVELFFRLRYMGQLLRNGPYASRVVPRIVCRRQFVNLHYSASAVCRRKTMFTCIISRDLRIVNFCPQNNKTSYIKHKRAGRLPRMVEKRAFFSDFVIEANNINSFKNKWNKFWANENVKTVKFNWSSDLTGSGGYSYVYYS